jgi:peptidase E
MIVRLLLLSNSGRPFLAWCRPLIAEFLAGESRAPAVPSTHAGAPPARERRAGATTVAFVTAATLGDERSYWQRARDALEPSPPEGIGATVLHCAWRTDPLVTLDAADAVFVGGGNTYALLKRLREAKLLEPIRERVRAGMPYIGSSAGSNVARTSSPRTTGTSSRSTPSRRSASCRSTSTPTTSRRIPRWRRTARPATSGSPSTTP